jgi:hypothetical protein
MQVGRRSQCKNLLLTHLSSRYTKLGAIATSAKDSQTGIAFDLMTLGAHNVHLPAAYLPAFMAMFPEDLAESEAQAGGEGGSVAEGNQDKVAATA